MTNEQTSKRVASKAAKLARRMWVVIKELERIVDDIESVAMSALTQAPDKKSRRKA